MLCELFLKSLLSVSQVCRVERLLSSKYWTMGVPSHTWHLISILSIHCVTYLTYIWLYIQINRTKSTGTNWQPGANSRVCSCHFRDGYPTPENPDPTENLGKLS